MDSYEILELSKECTKDEINNAYKKLMIKWHPDKNKNNKDEAIKKFKEITNAYNKLINEKNGTLIDPYELFKNMTDDDNNNKIPNIIITIEAETEKLHKGFCENISFTRFSECLKCESYGTIGKNTSECIECIECNGKGSIISTIEKENGKIAFNESQCEICNGNGINPNADVCDKCNGYKYVPEIIECDVDVPAGAYDNYSIMLESEGNYIPIDERDDELIDRTNVIVVIKEIPDKRVNRGMFIKGAKTINMADILIYEEINFANSIVGIKKEIEIFDEKIGVSIDGVIHNGDIHIVKNKGMYIVPEKQTDDKTRGDLFISFIVKNMDISKQKQYRIWQILTDTSYPEYDDIKNINETFKL